MAPSTRSSAASAAPAGPAGDAARLEALARALGLPRPFPSEENRAFLVRETWQQLAAALASQPVAVRPLGYYRTPDSVDIYVFEVALGEGEDRKTWRVYRRYRQFHKYVSSSSELLAGMVVPRLSQAYLKLFSAQTCKDRLEELHAWLQGVVDNTQAFCRQQAELQAAKDKVDAADTSAAAANTNVRVKLRRSESSAGELATTGLTNVRKRERAASNFDASRPLAKSSLEVQATGGDKENVRRNSVMGLGPTKADKASRQRERTSTYYRLQMDSVEARPLLLLSCFLLSGANCPFPHYFRGLPRFALAMEEINVEIKPSRHSDRGTALFPSRVRSSLATRSGLGLRLVPGHEQDGAFFGATVSGFSRDQNEVDPQLAKVPIGARLVRVNGIDTTSERFDEILTLLSASGRRPLRMRFINNPYATMRPLESSPESDERPTRPATMTTRGSFVDTSELSPMSGISQFRRSSANSSMLSTRSGMSAADVPVRTDTAIEAIASTKSNNQTDSSMRSYSVDARRNSSIFGTVFGDLFGRKRVDTADQAMADRHKFQSQTSLDDALASWDDAGGEFFDILSRGFYTPLPLALLRELREKRRRLKLGEDVLLYPSKTSHSPEEDGVQEKETRRTLEERRVTGVWSTTTGPLGLSLGACRVCGKEAAMLETTPTLFSSRLMGSEKRLRKGFVLVSINNESTFGWTFKRIASALASAPRPTAVSFRWFKDYSPYLETDFAEKVGVDEENDASMAFASGLDCVAEAQADLSTSLHLALVENASVRDEMVAYETSAREARVKLAASERANTALEGSLREKNTKIAILERQVAEVTQLLDKWQIRAKAAEEKLVAAKQEVQAASERARAEAMAKLAEQEDQLVRESNRSIANANALAERKTQKLLDATVQEMQRKHDEYLQKLAEEHSEEVESLMQQVAVWRHQVEVLTEAEKRNYAALMNNGINPYGGAHRSRFGYENDPANDDFARRPEKDDWRQPGRPPASKPKPSVGNKQEPTFSAARSNGSSSSGASQSQNGTFWDRMVSLLAAD